MPRPCPQTAHRVSLEAYGSVGSNQPPRFRCHAPKGHRISAQGANPGNLPGNILRVLKERRIVAGLKPRPRPQPSFLFRHSSLPLFFSKSRPFSPPCRPRGRQADDAHFTERRLCPSDRRHFADRPADRELLLRSNDSSSLEASWKSDTACAWPRW